MTGRQEGRCGETGRLARKLPNFLGVGAIGFLIDACVFFGLTAGLSVPYGWARIAASLVALSSTWLMNRNSTFADGRADTAPVEFLRYLAASLAGAGANLATLSMIAPYDQAMHHIPAYVVGAAVGLIVNFFLYDKFVFHGRAGRSQTRARPPENAP